MAAYSQDEAIAFEAALEVMNKNRFGISKGLRELFVSRVSSFAANLADWVLLPFALSTCLLRLFLASVIHPSLLT